MIVAAAALLIAISLVPLVGSFAWAPIVHYECDPGAFVASEALWTPDILVNSPFGGLADGTGSINPFGTYTVRESNGSSFGQFELVEWNISRSVRTLVAGPGDNAVCAGFLARSRLLGQGNSAHLLLNATSDAGENASVSIDGHESVHFDNGFTETDFTVGTCPGGPVSFAVTASHVVVQVPFSLDGESLTVSATVEGAFNWTYSFPGQFGTWSIDNLNAGAHAPGGGWAFSFMPCP